MFATEKITSQNMNAEVVLDKDTFYTVLADSDIQTDFSEPETELFCCTECQREHFLLDSVADALSLTPHFDRGVLETS